MEKPPQAPPPKWAPAYVRAAGGFDTAGSDALFSGEAWSELLDHLAGARTLVASPDAPSGEAEQTAGYRHLLVLLSLGIDEALRPRDPADPHLAAGNVDTVLKWGMDCPDAAYLGAPLDDAYSYRLSGRRGSVRYLGLQVMSGMETVANVVVDDLALDAEGYFEITLSREQQSDNWMPLPPGRSNLIVRQFFYDWLAEEPARLTLERIDTSEPAASPAPPGSDATAAQIRALGEFVEESLRFWLDVDAGTRAGGANRFREPDARTDIGGAAENITVWGSWELDDDEALLIEVEPPAALYWSLALGNAWWETLDYANRQTSLNGHQAELDQDGVFRAVVAHRDPGVANWLDTTGQHRGPMIFRWVRAESVPTATTRVVSFDELAKALPPDTARMDGTERRHRLAQRRRGVRRRFAR